MRKAGLLAIAVLAVAVLGLPAVFGSMTESQMRARIAGMDDGSPLLVAIDDYASGWFSSSADLTLRASPEHLERARARGVELPAWLSPDVALPVRVELGHGPVGVNDGLFLGLSNVVAYADPDTPWVRDLTEANGMPYLFEFRGRTAFTGGLSFDAHVPPVDRPDENDFSGAEVEGTLRGNHLVAELDMDRLELTGDVSVRLTGVHGSADNRFIGGNQVTGTTMLEVAGLDLTAAAAGPAMLEMTDARLSTEGVLEDGSWRTRIDYTTGSIRTAAGGRIESAALGIRVDNLDAAALEEAQALLERSELGPDRAATLPEIEAIVNRMLAASPSLEIAPISFVSDGEPFDANVQVAMRADAAPVNVTQLVSGPLAWVGLVDAAADATVSKTLARRLAVQAARTQLEGQPDADPSRTAQLSETQATLMLVMLSGQGYLEETEDTYSTRVRLTDGTLTVNGQSLPLFQGQ